MTERQFDWTTACLTVCVVIAGVAWVMMMYDYGYSDGRRCEEMRSYDVSVLEAKVLTLQHQVQILSNQAIIQAEASKR